MPISRIGLVVHEGRPVAVQTAATVREWAAEHDIELATGLRKDDILVVINQSDTE